MPGCSNSQMDLTCADIHLPVSSVTVNLITLVAEKQIADDPDDPGFFPAWPCRVHPKAVFTAISLPSIVITFSQEADTILSLSTLSASAMCIPSFIQPTADSKEAVMISVQMQETSKASTRTSCLFYWLLSHSSTRRHFVFGDRAAAEGEDIELFLS